MSSAEITSKTFQIIAENALFLYLKMALKGLFYGQKRLFRSPISGLPGRLSGKLLSVINCHFQKGAGRSLDDTDDRQETGCSDECFQELRTQKPDQGSGFIMNRRERAYQFLMSITRYLSSLPGLLSGLSNTALFSASLRFM